MRPSLLDQLRRDYFGDGMPIQERQPEPITRSDRVLAACGAVFLIAVATYLPLTALKDRAYLEDRKTKVLEECVIETGRFNWCWMHLTK